MTALNRDVGRPYARQESRAMHLRRSNQRPSASTTHKFTDDADRTDWRFVVAPLAVALLAYPAIAITAPSAADYIFAGIAMLLLPLIAWRFQGLTWPVAWLLILVTTYGLSSYFGYNPAQGLKHTATMASLGIAFLTFASYGAAILSHRWVRAAIFIVIALDFVVLFNSTLSKNATGGLLIYLCALVLVVILRKETSGQMAAGAFAAFGVVVAYQLNFRFLVACSLIFLVTFLLTKYLSRNSLFWTGLIMSVSIIGFVIWFFVNVNHGGLASSIGQSVTQLSGHRANSGRDRLWLSIISSTSEYQMFGLGAGVLPSDILNTNLSSHSYYLQTYLQVGIFGVLTLAGFLIAIWAILSKARTTVGRFGAAIFIMFVVHNSMEVLMLQNSSLIALPAWATVGLAIALEHQNLSFAV